MQYATSCNTRHRLLQTTDSQHVTLKSILSWRTNRCIRHVYNLKKCKEYATKNQILAFDHSGLYQIIYKEFNIKSKKNKIILSMNIKI